jgi:NADH-quinone oxidoreductase subunit L
MESILHIFLFIPLVGFIISLILPAKKELLLSRAAFFTIGLQLLCSIVFLFAWLLNGHPILNVKDIVLFKSNDYEFYIDFCFDKITAVYLIVGAFLTFLVTIYSRYYLHRESGYKRFFNTILFFYLGYTVAIFSGNLETLFIGWEILGISSFLLIAFYRERYFPVKNALKVFFIYRIGDVGLILAMWMSHHLFQENITFIRLNNYELVHEHIQTHSFIGVFISLMILISAAAKSAQLPFSSWLPRAMEGPTPSSAIFYGSLSVHMGVFLLLRTWPFWEHQTSVRILIVVLGLSTSVVSTLIARVQSSVKSQIAYASIAQIGLIFIEAALGFEKLALIHFAGNAFLRTYQLLVSPSVVSYQIREQFYNFIPRSDKPNKFFSKKWIYSFYILSLKEWNLDSFLYKYLWSPAKKSGKLFNFFTLKTVFIYFIPIYLLGVASLFAEDYIPETIHHYLPSIFGLIGLMLVLKSFIERKDVILSWVLIILNHFCIVLAISFNEHYSIVESIWYISGIIAAGIIGLVCLNNICKREKGVDLNQFHGHVYEHPRVALAFLIACLGLSGFPITPTFIGEDLIFSHIHENQVALAFFTASSLIFDGLAVVRIYARVFLGPHTKTYHEIAYKSS